MRTVLLPLAFSDTLALGGMPLAVASGDGCNGTSAGLAPSECSAWQGLYDAAGGTSWSHCSGLRNDPCSCSYASTSSSPEGVLCRTNPTVIFRM